MSPYLPVAIFLGVVVIAAGGVRGRSRAARPGVSPMRQNQRPMNAAFERVRWSRGVSRVRFYLIAMLFVIFDVEGGRRSIPWAGPNARAWRVYGLLEMALFVAVLAIGIRTCLRKGGFPVGGKAGRVHADQAWTMSARWAQSSSVWAADDGALPAFANEMMRRSGAVNRHPAGLRRFSRLARARRT